MTITDDQAIVITNRDRHPNIQMESKVKMFPLHQILNICRAAIAITMAGYFSLSVAAPIDDVLNSLPVGNWYEVPDSDIKRLDPCPARNCSYSGVEGINGVTDDWNGGVYDTSKDKLIIWGGGHQGYGGNELYAFSVINLKWELLTQPSDPVQGNVLYYSDGRPSSRHTYDNLVYAPNVDLFLSMVSAVTFGPSGVYGDNVDAFDSNTKTWDTSRTSAPNPGAGGSISGIAAYDPVTGTIWRHGTFNSSARLQQYDPVNDTWKNYSSFYLRYYTTAAIDPYNHIMVAVGGGKKLVWDLNNPDNAPFIPATTGDTSLETAQAPGFEYDPVLKKFVGWSGGSDIFILDPETWVWTRLSLTGGATPTAANSRGTYGRFRYVPSKNIYVVVNKANENVFILKLTDGSGSASWPVISIAATPLEVNLGESTTLSWLTADVTSCNASSSTGIWSGSKAVSSGTTANTETVGPINESSVFSLTCTGSSGTVTTSVNVSLIGSDTGSDTGSGSGGVITDGLATATNPGDYVWASLESGSNVYIDRSYTYVSIPSAYQGLEVLRTANNDKNSTGDAFVSFEISQAATVYVAHVDNGANLPVWLSSWTSISETLTTTDRTLYLYKKDFAAGTVSLGGNGSAPSMFTVLLASSGGTDTGGTDTGGTDTGGTDTGTGTGGTGTGGTGTNVIASATEGGAGYVDRLTMVILMLLFAFLLISRKHDSGFRRSPKSQGNSD